VCGIAGIIDYRGRDKNAIRRAEIMCASLYHRGPDAQNIIALTNATIVHTRLALIDLKGGAQPLISSDQRYTITYNGEVYNYRALRKELERHWHFTTNSDTEVVLAAYVAWGERCLSRFNGMFSFFIWDSLKQEGFAARDLLGVKPFVYRYQSGEFIFSSEAKAIIAVLDSNPMANQEAILEYLVSPYFSGVETPMFEGLEYLQAGHYLIITKNNIRTFQWQDYVLSCSTTANKSSIDKMSNLLVDAIENTLVADVPIGTYLSGGFDSTLITSIASDHLRGNLDTFTIKFTDQDNYQYDNSLIITSNDTPCAADAARIIGVSHNIVHVNRSDLSDTIIKISQNNDALPAWEQEIAQHHLALTASNQYKIILVGDAADETHYGYPFLLDHHATKSPSGIIQRFSTPPINPSFISSPLNHFDEKYKALTIQAGYNWDSPMDRYLATTYLIVKRWLARLLHNGDIHAMSHSIETRVPFADTNLLKLARTISPLSAYQNGTEKWLLRESARGLMPEQARVRKKSALPKDQCTADLYKRIGRDLFSTSFEFLDHFLDMKKINHLCNPSVKLSEQDCSLLFRVISLCHWRNTYGVNIR
jgi:asparagine synthase (glutamine-hydrolysing)